MEWDIACLIFVCVTANHLGLISAIEETTERELPIVNCPKCLTFWSVLTYTAFTRQGLIASLAISLLSSYLALWLELAEGFIDTLYNICYEKVYRDTENGTSATDADIEDTDSAMPDVRQEE